MTADRSSRLEASLRQRRFIAWWLLVMGLAWSLIAAGNWLADDGATFVRWAWTLLAVASLSAGVWAVRRVRKEGDRAR